MNFTCKYCNKQLASISSLNTHIKRAQYCIKKRGLSDKLSTFICEGCKKTYTSKQNLNIHKENCSKFLVDISLKNHNEKHEEKLNNIINQYKEKLQYLKEQLKEQKHMIYDLQNKLENIAIKAIQNPFEENEESIDSEDTLYQFKKEYKLSSLNIGEGYNIEHREEDGYINITNLCKAGEKKFYNWERNEKTGVFLQALSLSMGIHINELVIHKTGSTCEQTTWVHPHVAINIAQWISPVFDVKVSAWVYEAMMTGKVDISNTKTYKEVYLQNKILKNKYLKRHPRIKYKDKYVIYILTTRLMQKERRYIMGKATDLTNRLSTYNKSDEHRVVYFQGCGDEDTMSVVENMVFHHLQKYREQANRERFILPENEEITLFSNAVQKSVEYCKKL
jgi:hypothetical protein